MQTSFRKDGPRHLAASAATRFVGKLRDLYALNHKIAGQSSLGWITSRLCVAVAAMLEAVVAPHFGEAFEHITADRPQSLDRPG